MITGRVLAALGLAVTAGLLAGLWFSATMVILYLSIHR